MRIVGGQYSGRRIVAPKGDIARPTTDRIREALFSILQARDDFSFANAHVIDLFAGSGALGLEALSRGAAWALFVEESAAARAAIRDNIEALGLFGATRIHRRSAIKLGEMPASAKGPFNIAFLDPPYGASLSELALNELLRGNWLAPDVLIVIEQGKSEPPCATTGVIEIDRRLYGDTQIGIYRLG